MVKNQFTSEDHDLLAELGVEVEEKKAITRTAKEERIIAGFEEIERFVEENDRLPQHGEDKDIFERLYAVRLDKIRQSEECQELLKEFDHKALLDRSTVINENHSEDMGDAELLSELGITATGDDDITKLKHVRTRAEIKAAEEIAQRTPCEDFNRFKPLFDTVQNEIKNGVRKVTRFRKEVGFAKSDIKQGEFFILGGQIAYVAEVGDDLKQNHNGQMDARLRVIYDNGTESDLLRSSFSRAMYKDEASRIISEPSAGPLFSDITDDDDIESGTIYVLRSNSNDPYIKENRDIIHKIGVTGGDIKKRLTNAENDPTFLMAGVEVVATYQLSNINRVKLEKLIHKFFDSAKLNIEIQDRFGKTIMPREWFLVPLFVIDEMVEKIKDRTILHYNYDYKEACFKNVTDLK